jgi:hypothetical protein
MQAPDPIETILARLMPPALSQAGQSGIESMLDELAGPEAEKMVPVSSGKRKILAVVGGGIAAAVAGLLALAPGDDGISSPPAAAATQIMPEFMLVSESDRVESMTDEGWQEDSGGSAMHALRLVAVEENQVKDTESGMVVLISETREEILFSPISSF